MNIAELKSLVPAGSHAIIFCDGEVRVISEQAKMRSIKRAMNADTVDFVTLTWAGSAFPDLVMIVNDHGYETRTVDHGNGHIEVQPVAALLPDNPVATALYHEICEPGTTHRIVGHAAIVHDQDFAS